MSSLNNTFSYSGSDCRAFASKGFDIIELKSLNTVSVSVYESKSPVRRLGHRNVVGFTKSIRTIAGSMILTVVEEHPLQELARAFSNENVFSLDKDFGYIEGSESSQSIIENRLSTILPDFDLSLYYKSEAGKDVYAKSRIVGIEFINESIVTSVNDMVTEISLQFVAKDFAEFTGYGSREQLIFRTQQAAEQSESPSQDTETVDTIDSGNDSIQTVTRPVDRDYRSVYTRRDLTPAPNDIIRQLLEEEGF